LSGVVEGIGVGRQAVVQYLLNLGRYILSLLTSLTLQAILSI